MKGVNGANNFKIEKARVDAEIENLETEILEFSNIEIIKTNKGEGFPDLSLYFHLPYCDSLCYFCGCNMLVTRKRNRIRNYISYLKQEIDMISRLLFPAREAAQMHWGGGTPTHLDPDEIADLADYIRQRFRLKDNIEAGCEIDPIGTRRQTHRTAGDHVFGHDRGARRRARNMHARRTQAPDFYRDDNTRLLL